MGNSNSCSKLDSACFNWKKNKILRKNKRLCESIVMLQDDGSVGIQKLPASRILMDRHHTWDYDLTRNEKHQSYPSATQSLELITFPSEDKLVKKSGMEKTHFNKALLNTIPPPIPLRKVEGSTCSAILKLRDGKIVTEVTKPPIAEQLVVPSENTCIIKKNRLNAELEYESPSLVWPNSNVDVERTLPREPPPAFESVIDGKSDTCRLRKRENNADMLPPIPPRRHESSDRF
ncbi:uncharacterized protein CDAR_572771 [Caerostris darwini]|uniref:Uncharacterized protein n=1 Tax=Caerostris darwini TaxID=1538125 RepID=A0AAV4W7V3_9ARAC|nr:uncharacterized protein CDAR_572771 [Caerostris darwini]